MEVGRCQSWVSKVERNLIDIDSVTVLNAVARTLEVHPNEISGRLFEGFNPAVDSGHTAVLDATRQLRRAELPAESEHHRPLSELATALTLVTRQRGEARYARIVADSVDLLAELHVAYECATGREQEDAYGLFALVCKELHSAAYGLGLAEVIALSQMRAAWASARSGNPHLLGMSDYLAARDLWTTNDYGDALFVLDRSAVALQSSAERGDAAAASLFGSLHLRAAVTAARSGNADEAYARLAIAEQALAWAPPADPYTMWWSAGNVGIHYVGVAAELCDGVEAVRRAGDLSTPLGLPKSRLGHFYLDLSRAHIWLGNGELALAALERADRLAPELVRHHPLAQGTVRQLLRSERASTRERLRSIARRCHVE